ncbi:hypothetical protein GN244_ATG01357 [Phytophthora infestans]|uniref:PH domain-containing protein n=1 Tax=Phytophthora infestans TaxID=4787 RepID=A0A833TAN7_PHYIN|nr:hypothetical protein GN244_ATG01357 [Phytophthora infestans]KAF4141969.1 hypothetical protein GN958_ATG08858 [Phytophthora infestans]
MTTPSLALPLHPRRAQQLFQDVLLTDSELTPKLSDKSLPRRLLELQRLNLAGIQEGKRGTRFQHIPASNPQNEAEEVTLTLTKDGSTLQVATETQTGIISISLVDIKGLLLQETPLNSFSLLLDDPGDGDDNIGIFVASSADMLNRWVVALTCGVGAFQRLDTAQQSSPDAMQADLVWQAVRLRIFELAGVLGIPAAIDHVTLAIPDQDYQQSETLRRRVQFLQCNAART